MAKLLDRGANADSRDTQQNTPLHYAARNGWTSVAEKLMSQQGQAIINNKDGLIPLELAIHYGHNECATFLVNWMEPVRYITNQKHPART